MSWQSAHLERTTKNDTLIKGQLSEGYIVEMIQYSTLSDNIILKIISKLHKKLEIQVITPKIAMELAIRKKILDSFVCAKWVSS